MKHFKLFFQFSLCFFSLTISAQETGEYELPKEEMQKLKEHLANYTVPPVSYLDSVKTINYTVEFIINENGRIINPKITDKSFECPLCEDQLLFLMDMAPKLYPIYPDDKKVRVRYILPFKLQIER